MIQSARLQRRRGLDQQRNDAELSDREGDEGIPSTRSDPRSRSVTHTETRPPVLAISSSACIVAAKEGARPDA
ncbi:hypothetical protein [Microbacterium schleiferi]|uniref:hypothetical protein n=1 Tax=Microbacterium schleiferi TaxID=69362 RepID=UPI001E404F70|nr:hypothetical protein [Microbacterium schleiferi]